MEINCIIRLKSGVYIDVHSKVVKTILKYYILTQGFIYSLGGSRGTKETKEKSGKVSDWLWLICLA